MKIRRYRKTDKRKVQFLIISVLKSIYGKTKVKWEDFNIYERIYLAINKDKIIGVVALKKVDNEWVKLKRMYVKKDYQRKGVGEKLLKKIENYARKKHFKKIVLTSYAEMKRGVEFYKKHGFKIVKNPPDKFFTDPTRKKYNSKQVAMEKILK